MNLINIEETNKLTYNKNINKNNLKKFLLFFRIAGFIIVSFFFIIIMIDLKFLNLYLMKRENSKNMNISKNSNKFKLGIPLEGISSHQIKLAYKILNFESNFIFLSEINKKRNFKIRYPFPKSIKCYEHMREGGLIDMVAFISFLTKDTIFFEFGSGCTSVIAKYYSKKSFAVEGNLNWYKEGIKNGLKDNIIFKDIKAIKKGKLWSEPGKDSSIEDWKKYFQAYKKEYNADVIFIDGRFRIACAFDIFNKIKNDTIILIHEYRRKAYLIIEKYYDYVYHWNNLFLFKKKRNINEIPLDFQKKFCNDST